MTVRFLLVCVMAISACSKGNTNEIAFLNPLLVEGIGRPGIPQGLTSSYDAYLQYLCIRWNPSIDPDTANEVPLYRLYLYFVYPPTAFYRDEDLHEEVVVREHCIETESYTGTLTFIVTGFDGFAESLPSEPLVVAIP